MNRFSVNAAIFGERHLPEAGCPWPPLDLWYHLPGSTQTVVPPSHCCLGPLYLGYQSQCQAHSTLGPTKDKHTAVNTVTSTNRNQSTESCTDTH